MGVDYVAFLIEEKSAHTLLAKEVTVAAAIPPPEWGKKVPNQLDLNRTVGGLSYLYMKCAGMDPHTEEGVDGMLDGPIFGAGELESAIDDDSHVATAIYLPDTVAKVVAFFERHPPERVRSFYDPEGMYKFGAYGQFERDGDEALEWLMGTDEDLREFFGRAHRLGLAVALQVIP